MIETGARQKTESQSLKAVLGVRELVYSGEFKPGSRVSEVTVSARLGLSRTPVRAALARMEQEGVLDPIPSGGYAVRAFSQGDIVDAIELRGVLEGTAARLAAERGVSPARLAAANALLGDLDAIVGGGPDSIDFQAYVQRNSDFHELLWRLADSAIIRREIERAVRLPLAHPSAFLHTQADNPVVRASLRTAQSQHSGIINAIEMREGARAEALAREHARLARQNLDYVLENRKSMSRVPGLALVSA